MDPHLQDHHIGEYVDVEKLETLICLELLIAACYQALAGLLHNKHVCHECQQFERQAMYHQEKLRAICSFSKKSEDAIEHKLEHHLLHLKPSYLSLREVINLTFNLTVLKTDIYKYFSRTFQEYKEFSNSLLEDSAEEMHFLRQERNFHQNRMDTYLKS